MPVGEVIKITKKVTIVTMVWRLYWVFFNMCFKQELKKYGVTTIVRVCEATYDTTLVEKEGIHVLVSI